MSQHTHTTCDGCGEEMELHEYGQMSGTISLNGRGDEIGHFHSPLCLARFAAKVNNGLYDQSRFRVVVGEGVTDGQINNSLALDVGF